MSDPGQDFDTTMTHGSDPGTGPTRSVLDVPETPWTAVLRASAVEQDLESCRQALGELCELYRSVVLLFFRLKDPTQAEDLAQDFLANWLVDGRLANYRRLPRVRFRHYLTTALRHAWIDRLRRLRTIERHGGPPLSIENHPAGQPDEPDELSLAATTALDREAALAIHRRCLALMAERHRNPDRRERFDTLAPLLLIETTQDQRNRAAARLGLSANAFQQALFRLRDEWIDAFRAEVRKTVTVEDLEDEMRHLIRLMPSALESAAADRA